MTITIETDESTCTVTEDSVSVERLATMFFQAAVGVGFHPKPVAEWMCETGEIWLGALEDKQEQK